VATVNPRVPKSTEEGVEIVRALAAKIADNEVGRMIFNDFLPNALAEGIIKTKPDPFVVGKGLEDIQAALDMCKAGVSAQKLVVKMA